MARRTFLRIQCATPLVVLMILTITLCVALRAEAGTTFKTLHKFKKGKGGGHPYGKLVFDAAGNLYGTTLRGGDDNLGTVFKLTPNGDGSWTETVLLAFAKDGSQGGLPYSGVIFDDAGNLYGTASWGGANGWGTVFELTPNADGSWTESVLHSFTGQDGEVPYAGLIFDVAGNLYGTTPYGGGFGAGTVFQLTPNLDGSWTESVLHSFNVTDGAAPFGGLTFDEAGNLYGTTRGGGSAVCIGGCGVAFKLAPNADGTWTESVIHFFKLRGTGGYAPSAPLIFDPAGNLYGTATRLEGPRGGTVFELAPNGHGGWAEIVLHVFHANQGTYPAGGLTFDLAGNLYGTTVSGGAHNSGTVFKLTPNADGTWKETVPHAFPGEASANPQAGVILDAHGNLYGTTYGWAHHNGQSWWGTVFEIIP